MLSDNSVLILLILVLILLILIRKYNKVAFKENQILFQCLSVQVVIMLLRICSK